MHRKPFASSKRDVLLKLFGAALEAVDGRRRVAEALSESDGRPVWIVAVGKAAAAMALGAYDRLSASIQSALVITKDNHGSDELIGLPGARVLYAAHPVPDARSLEAGAAMLEFARVVPAGGHVIVLLSGGASSLCEALPGTLSASEWERLNRWYMRSGCDIGTINAVRSRISRLKAGRWMHELRHAQVSGLAISDVPGDDPTVIGSGLLAAGEAEGPAHHLPDWVEALVTEHAQPPSRARASAIRIIARNEDAVRGASLKAAQLGFSVAAAPERFGGDAGELGERIANETLGTPGVLRIYGGEPTVSLPPAHGEGGRAQHLALTAARRAAGFDEFYLLAAGSDGTDGPGEAAGALVNHGTRMRGQDAGLDIERSLQEFDSGRFLAASGDLIDTGPTGTNVGDIVIAWAPIRERG